MKEYLFLLLSIIFFQVITYRFEKTFGRKAFVFLSYTAITIFIIMQKVIGPDYYSYMIKYTQLANVTWREAFSSLTYLSIEPGFRLVNKIFSLLNVSPELFLRIYMIILMFLNALVCYKYSKNPIIYTILFLVFLYKWVLLFRQASAVVIIMLGYKFVKEKKPFKYLLTIFIAMNFHVSAVVALLIYPIYNCKENKVKYLRTLIIISILVIVIFNKQIIYLCQQIISILDSRYVRYFNNNDIALNMIIILLSFLIIEYLVFNKNQKENNISINIMFLVLFIQCLCFITSAAGRIIMYFYPIMFLSLERIFIEQDTSCGECALIDIGGNQKIIIYMLFGGFMLYFWWYTFIQYNPYISIL